jgi:uncharacterized coiled-coil protein SlyX
LEYPLVLVGEYLGHENPQTTKIYAYADSEMKRKALEKVDEHLGNTQDPAIWENNEELKKRLSDKLVETFRTIDKFEDEMNALADEIDKLIAEAEECISELQERKAGTKKTMLAVKGSRKREHSLPVLSKVAVVALNLAKSKANLGELNAEPG